MTSPTPDICGGIRGQLGWYPSLLGVAAESELTFVSDEAWWAPLQLVLNSTSSSTVSSIQTQHSPFLTLPRSLKVITVSALWWRSGWRKTWNPDPELQHLLFVVQIKRWQRGEIQRSTSMLLVMGHSPQPWPGSQSKPFLAPSVVAHQGPSWRDRSVLSFNVYQHTEMTNVHTFTLPIKDSTGR